MNHLFVSYQLCLQLKKLGFNEPCFGFYKANLYILGKKDTAKLFLQYRENQTFFDPNRKWDCLAITYQQVMDWLRENHNIEVRAKTWISPTNTTLYFPSVYIKRAKKKEFGFEWSDELFYNKPQKYSYYEALDKAISKSLKSIK